MSRESLVFVFGIMVFITPLVGVPPAWKDYALIVFGVLLVLIGFSLRRSAYYRKISRGNGEVGTDFFVESTPKAPNTLTDYVPEDAEIDKAL